MPVELSDFIHDFSMALKAADARNPRAENARSKELFQPRIAPHSEARTVQLVAAELAAMRPADYERIGIGVSYPESPRQKCDLCLGEPKSWEWAIEVKMLRLLGDNGKINDNMLMHILSPYAEHRSALTDCAKLARTRLARRHAVLIYGFEREPWPLEPALRAFEVLAADLVELGPRHQSRFDELVHQIHRARCVAGWEIGCLKKSS
jgi:hypothetical protein